MSTLRGTDVPELYMSSFPQTMAKGVNHCRPCKEWNKFKTGMYQWDIMLSMSYTDLIKDNADKPVSTMYPVIFASNDAKTWKVVADADDVAHGISEEIEPNHISAPLLIAKLKNFGCVDDETHKTDPFIKFFGDKKEAQAYKWKLVEHVAMHGSVNLVACVMQGMDDINQLIHTYVRHCKAFGGSELKCHLSPKQALQKCFAIGSACGQACGFFSPKSPHCIEGKLNPAMFEGLTPRRVKIKAKRGGGSAEALIDCSKRECQSGLQLRDIYVEAENPLEFLDAQRDVRNKEKGSFNVMVFAVSDFHKKYNTTSFTVKAKKPPHHHHHLGGHHLGGHHLGGHHLKESHHLKDDVKKHSKPKPHKKDDHKEEAKKDKKEDDEKKDEKEDEEDEEDDEEEEEEEEHKRTCVDLPGVRLKDIDHSGLVHWEGSDKVSNPKQCTEQCGTRVECKQAVWANKNQGCYLFKLATVEVNEFSGAFNSSFCGDAEDEDLMMTMLHQAYKGYVPAKPAAPPAGPPGAPPPIRVLSEESTEESPPRMLSEESPANMKYYWQIAHVPNLTMGVLKDQGASSMRIIPRNGSCFTTPGFIYMVACMTAKPVYMSGRTLELDPWPFNDRCLAVGGLCGATCGSGQEVDENVAKDCPLERHPSGRRLTAEEKGSIYASARIPKSLLVKPIEPRRSSSTRSLAARVFFHLFIFFIAISYIATLLGKFPGNFTDFYPVHTWEEIRTHGYVLEQYGSAVSVGISATESKMVVFRNWLGKISGRPLFDDPAYPTFAKWVDVFCDEGHREGARILWQAWGDFLDTDPPIEFLAQWAVNLQTLTWEQAATRSPFDLAWEQPSRKILPVVKDQLGEFLNQPGLEVPEGGVALQPDALRKLRSLADIFMALPDNLKLEPALVKTDDCILTRKVMLDYAEGLGKKASACRTIKYSTSWKTETDKHIQQIMEKNGIPVKDKETFKKSLMVTDTEGKKIDLAKDNPEEGKFPLHLRTPPQRQDREVILVYCARAKPETDRKGIDKTRTLDKYLWACLRPKAVRRDGEKGAERRSFKGNEERRPLLGNSMSRESNMSENMEKLVLDEVRKCVRGVVDRQREKFINRKDITSRRNKDSSWQKEYAKAYLKYRTVDSDWEMARFCYGEIVGEERDADGDEVLILDNPSPALLELVTDLHRPGMGLVALETEEGKNWYGGKAVKRTARVAKPNLEFLFANTSGTNGSTSAPPAFQQELRKRLQEAIGGTAQDMSSLVIQVKSKGSDLVTAVTGPGKLIEPIRDRNLCNLKVLNYMGRMIDSHPTVIVKKHMLMPFAGVRGKAGGLNYVVDLLQFRDGYIGTGAEGDPTPERMLYGIFDARHQPHPDYWKNVIPKFVHNTDAGYTYEPNDDIALVQAPQSFAAVKMDDDVLDVHNGLCFNLMNVIRNRCGGVTSCGTNAVWQVNAKEFSRQGESAESGEYFDSRTKIEDTASSHIQFCAGKRSVYVQEKISTGIAKLNADYLCALERWAEGAVQLFWLQIFVDRTKKLVFFGLGVIAFIWLLYLSLYGGWIKGATGKNLFCDVEGTPTLLLGNFHPLCRPLYGLFDQFLEHTIDKVIFKMAAEDYMRLIDFAITWFIICCCAAAGCVLLSLQGIMPRIVRVFIMMENISYWLTSCSIFFWLSLTLFMIIGMNPPLMFNVTHFMMFILFINICQHCMVNEYKFMGGCSELSIWRSQQAYTLAAPLYMMAIARGTAAAWGITWHRLDKSFWTSKDHGADVIRGVTVWVTFIWSSFILCAGYLLVVSIKRWLFNEIGDKIQKQCQVVAVMMLGLLAITVWEPFLTLWGLDKSITGMTKPTMDEDGKEVKSQWQLAARVLVWWRGKAWIMRYIIDFGMPFLVLSGALGGGVSLLILSAHATVIHGFRV